MSAYFFFAWALTLIGLVTCPWPLTVPLAALAYKVRLGNRPVPMETSELWLRSAFAALGLALIAAAFAGIQWFLGGFLQIPRGPVAVVIFLRSAEDRDLVEKTDPKMALTWASLVVGVSVIGTSLILPRPRGGDVMKVRAHFIARLASG